MLENAVAAVFDANGTIAVEPPSAFIKNASNLRKRGSHDYKSYIAWLFSSEKPVLLSVTGYLDGLSTILSFKYSLLI